MLPAQLATVSARHARHAALWGLGFVALLLTLMPAVAAYAKLSFIQLLADRTPIAELPAWIFTYGKLGLVEICGRAATNAAAVADACAALPETAQGLRLQDITLSPDMIVLALPDMAEVDHVVLGLLAAAALAVAIATANGPLSAIVRALGRDDPPSGAESERRNSRLASYAIAALALTAATGGALLRPLGILDAAAYAFVIAAVGLFPALFAGLWWRRANAYGAAAAMLAGLAIALVYLVGARYFTVPFYEGTAALSNAGAEGFNSFADLKDAWIAAAPGADKDAAWAALQAQASDNANWWGVDGLAVALLALPVGFVALVVVSLVTPAPRPAETAP
jgi:cation/acetate symporter